MPDQDMTRRDSILTVGAALAGAAAFGVGGRSLFAEESSPARKPSLRVAHLTDIHVQPEKRAAEGLASCLHHVQQLSAKPDLILTGGDSIMDSFDADDARTSLQWDIWQRVLKSDCSHSRPFLHRQSRRVGLVEVRKQDDGQ